MAIFNQIDTGAMSLNKGPSSGQATGSVLIDGYETITWGRGGKAQKRSTVINVMAPNAIGGAAADTRAAVRFVVAQLVEMANNRALQPVYVQWQSGGGWVLPDPYDGWYVLEEVTPLDFTNIRHVPCQVTATWVAPAAPRAISLAYAGGPLATNYGGAAQNLITLPHGSLATEAAFFRLGASGLAAPGIPSPLANPEPFQPPAAITEIWNSPLAVRVYDTLIAGGNNVPTSGGAYVHANWVEVLDPRHNFQGDCVITNGLLLLLMQIGSQTTAQVFLWNTAVATPTWLHAVDLGVSNNASESVTMRSMGLKRVGTEESSVVTVGAGASGQPMMAEVRLGRGNLFGRVDVTPLAVADTSYQLIYVNFQATFKISYNTSGVSDNVLSEPAPGIDGGYGHGAAFINSASWPFIAGILYQNKPSGAGSAQPGQYGNSTAVTSADTTSLGVNARRSYGFFVTPYGVSGAGAYSPANLQAEAESGTLSTGWSSIVDALASGGNAANLASGTLGNFNSSDVWGTAFIPAPGVYDVWVRMKATTHTSATAQLQVGLFDSDASGYIGASILAPNQVTGAYAWYRVGNSVTPTAGHNMRIRANASATTTDAWQIDESVLVPRSLPFSSGPQDLWTQFMYDRVVQMIRQ